MSAQQEKVEINRLKVGVISAVCLISALVLYLIRGESLQNDLWLAGLIRVGVLCAAFCLALPGKNQKAAWANVSPTVAWGLLIGLIILVRVPFKAFMVLIPILMIGFVIGKMARPKPKERPDNRPE